MKYGLDISPAGAWGEPRVPPDRGWEDVTADDVRRLRESAEVRPGGAEGFVIAVAGLESAGADWWHEYVPPRLTLDEARRRIESGPVRPADG